MSRKSKVADGAIFGAWTVVERARRVKGYPEWLCQCQCGKLGVVPASNLTSGKSESCGCLRSIATSKRKTKDILGHRFERLTVIERVTKGKTAGGYTRVYWRCACICGKTVDVSSGNLLSGTTRSCGCLKKDILHVIKSKTIEDVIHHQIWSYYRRNAKTRGITWELSKEEFVALLRAPCYYCGIVGGTITKCHSSKQRQLLGENGHIANNGVDRIDSSMPYSSENCVTACKTCNMSKNDMTVNEFISWVKRVADHQNLHAKRGGI